MFEIFGSVLTSYLLIVLILIFHYIYLVSNRNYWKNRGVFSPNSASFFGNLPGQVNGKRHFVYELDDLYQKYKNSHAFIGIFSFRNPRFLVFDPQIARDILIKYFRNFQATELYGKIDTKSDPLFGSHMFFQIGDEWKNARQTIVPAFTSNRIKAIYPILQNVMKDFEKFLVDFKTPKGFDAKDIAARYAISIVVNSIYNIDPKTFDGSDSEIYNIARTFLMPTKKTFYKQMLWSIYPFTTKFVKFAFSQPQHTAFFHELMMNSISQREVSNVKNYDYLEFLIDLKKKKNISDEGISAHGAAFLGDGFEITSSTIAAALYLLAKHQDIQEKLRNEIMAQMPTDDDVTYDNVMSLEYLDQIWYETLRLYNPATHIARICTEDITLDLPRDKKVSFVKGDFIYVPMDSMAKDPEYFENPKKFDPDRFSPENGGVKQYIDRAVFLPFGMGPRTCIGNRFALLQGKFTIISLLRKFKITVNPATKENVEIHPQSVIASLYECLLDFEKL